MRTNLLRLFRAIAVALALTVWTNPVAEAGWWDRNRSTSVTSATPVVKTHCPPGDPVVGVAMIAVGVAVFVFLAWVAVRIGGKEQ